MPSVSRTLTIVNKKGLHARASARFVEAVEAFDADAVVTREDQSVGGDSIMGLLMLAASQGTTIDVRCKGPEAELLIDALDALVAGHFWEEG